MRHAKLSLKQAGSSSPPDRSTRGAAGRLPLIPSTRASGRIYRPLTDDNADTTDRTSGFVSSVSFVLCQRRNREV
jgi:hypothetical protein